MAPFQTTATHRIMLWMMAALVTAGCSGTSPPIPGVNDVSAAYERGDYATAYRNGATIAQTKGAPHRQTAAYLAGLSAHKLGHTDDAARLLRQATGSMNKRLVTDARAQLGLVYAKMDRYEQSAHELLLVAESLSGQHRANAYLYAAVSQQKIGRWAQAQTNLVLARAASDNPAFHQRVAKQVGMNGYTVQVGDYPDPKHAQLAARKIAQRTGSLELTGPRLVSGKDAFGRQRVFVQVGQFATFESAQQARVRIGDRTALIVLLSK